MPIFFRPQITPYVILFIERDGSTYLTSLLMSHPDIQAIYERFAVLKQKGVNAHDQLEWASRYLARPMISRYKAVGFKTKLVDVLDPDGFVDLLRQKNCKIIQMRRRNFIKAVVSKINARRLYEASGNWNLYNEADRMPAFEIDPQTFDQLLKEREQADRDLSDFVGSLELPTINVEYEDLLINKSKTLCEVFNFLGVQNLPVESKTLKHTSDDLRQVVQNLDELRAHYDGTIYQRMFDEVLAASARRGDADRRVDDPEILTPANPSIFARLFRKEKPCQD